MPTSVPTTVVIATTTSAMVSEICEPTMPRDRISRPNLSVPRKWIGRPSVAPKKWISVGISPSSLYGWPLTNNPTDGRVVLSAPVSGWKVIGSNSPVSPIG